MRCLSPKNPTVIIASLVLAAGILVPLAFAPPARAAGEPSWVDARGPGNGDAMALAYDDTRHVIYRATIGSAGNTQFGKGVWKYEAGQWTSLGGEVASLGINTLAYDSAGDRLYAGSYGLGVWCYNPSDGTWTELDYDMRDYNVTALAFGGGKLYAGLMQRAYDPAVYGNGVWCYDPAYPSAGFTDTGGGVAAFRIRSLAWGGEVLYAGPEDPTWPLGVWYYDPASPNDNKWTDTDGGMYHRRATALAWDYDSDLLYSSAGYTGVFYYDPASSAADKWTRTQSTVWPFFSCEVRTLAYGEGKVYAGSLDAGFGYSGVWSYDRTTDIWSDTGGGMSAYETKSLAFDTYRHHLFAGTSQDGVWRYNLSDNPPTWSDTGGGVSTSYVNCLAYDSAGRLLYVGTQSDGVWRYDPTTSAWTDISGGVGAFETRCLVFGGGKLYAGCYDHNAPAYVGVWCYDPASPNTEKWTDTGSTAPAVNRLVYDEERGLLYAGTGEYYGTGGGQGVWSYDPASPGWTDISGDDIDGYYIDSLALGGGDLYAGCYDPGNSYKGVWAYDTVVPGGGWTSTGGGTGGVTNEYQARALAWGNGRLYASCYYWKEYPTGAKGVWVYDPAIPAPDKWASTGGLLANSIIYDLAWDGEDGLLYASCWYAFTGSFDGVWYYDPGAGEWGDTHGGVEKYYVSSLVYDGELHRIYAGTGGEGAWYCANPPAIDSLGPATGGVGAEVTIHGSRFGPGDTGSEYVTFGGVPAVVKPGTWTDGSVVCYVPAGVSGTVPVVVHNLNGASNGMDFGVIAQHIITASAGAGGSISPSGAVVVNHGTSRSFAITPNAGYHVADVLVDGASKGAVTAYTFTNVTQNHTIRATFVPDEPPPPPAASTWYLAEGSTDWGFDCYVSIVNPNDTAVNAKVTYMTSAGPVPGPTVAMPPFSQATVYPASTLGAADFSTKVECIEGKSIAVDRTMYWTGLGAASTEAHCATGVTSPATTWYMPEGSSAWGFECWLLIQNPGAEAANCQVTWMIQGEAAVTSPVTVPAGSRSTFNMADFIGAKDASIRVTSDAPVIPERAMYRNNRREGHDSGGTTTAAADYYLAEGCTGFGFTTYVLVQNPQPTPTEVSVTYQAASGPVPGPSFVMPANSRHTICVNDSTQIPGPDPSFSTHVHGSAPIIAERAMYWHGGPDGAEACHDSIGLDQPHTAWFLADGQSSDGRETFVLVQNPSGEDVQVEITYMTPTGAGNQVRDEIIPANSRRTFAMAEHSGITGRAAIQVICGFGRKVMVERAMYWNSRGTGTDTIGAYAD